MAVRTPLYNDSGNIKQMSSAMVDEIVAQCVYQYSLNPSVTLSVVSSGGSVGTINDTRLQAGSSATSVSSFPSSGATPDVSTVTVANAKINQTNASVTPTADTGKLWPVYYNSSNQIQAMSITDVQDTFLHPAIDILVSGSTGTSQGGTYHISTSTSVSGSTLVSSTPVFIEADVYESVEPPTQLTVLPLPLTSGTSKFASSMVMFS